MARTLMLFALFAAVAIAAGAQFGVVWGWAALSLQLAALSLYHARQVGLLSRWAAPPGSETVPETRGAWGELFTLIYHRQRTEIRQRRQLARLLARSRQAGRALPYGVAILDDELRIVWCNDSSERHFDIHSNADARQPITNLVRQPEFVGYVLKREYSTPLELATGRGGGPVLSVQLVPYEDSSWLLLSRDVTQATRLEAMRRDFVANVSHELRTPLTVLVGFLETLRDPGPDLGKSDRHLELMDEQAKRMQRILDDLLALSTLESAPEPPGDERVGMNTLLQRIRLEAEALSGGSHRIRLDASPGYDLLGSEPELASAFTNLASNAVRYTPAGGEIRLEWRAGPDGATFAVEDSGIGVEPEHIPRLTERFYRVDRGRSRATGGTGLGLAIVKHALARHQATLHITSEPGKGSRFSAHFPLRRVAPAPAAIVTG
jgi:two-component system phosphate regulon sensor histidine kinase PhoR